MSAPFIGLVLLLEATNPAPGAIAEKLTCVDGVDWRTVDPNERPGETPLVARRSRRQSERQHLDRPAADFINCPWALAILLRIHPDDAPAD